MFEKSAIFSGKTSSGSPLIHLVEPGTGYGLQKTASLEKTASKEHIPEVQELLESIAPQPGRLYLVNSALGAGEYVGFNLRGDWFTEAGLTREPPGWKDIPVWDVDARRRAANTTTNLGRWGDLTWGYPTFYNAHRFRHHVNKDPNKAYGFVLGAFWDDRMKRVVLVSELVEDMCRNLGAIDLYKKIQEGAFPDSSMGSKVPYDRCAICGNKARNPAQYCEHVGRTAMPPHGMGKLLPDGRRCGVYNDYPRFFDDSFVFVGAERSAKVMANVTDEVSGQNKYSQNIYPFAPKLVVKLANARDSAITNAQKHDPTINQRIEIAVRQIPVSSTAEKSALRYFANLLRSGQKVKDGMLSKEEFIHMDIQMRHQFMQHNGSPIDNFEYVRDQLMAAVRHMVNSPMDIQSHEKAASFDKWAELFKDIPGNTKYLSMAKSQCSGMRPLPPEIMDMAKKDPHSILGQLGRAGIVLRPSEFQDIMLPKSDPTLATMVKQKRILFSPQSMSHSNLGVSFPMSQSISSDLMPLLSDFLLKNRSFSPKAVRIRITKTHRPEPSPPMSHLSHPILDEIGKLYNTYRYGIMKNMGGVDNSLVKISSFCDITKEEGILKDAHAISKVLFSTGYWPFSENVID
jgi:hypothetical protein